MTDLGKIREEIQKTIDDNNRIRSELDITNGNLLDLYKQIKEPIVDKAKEVPDFRVGDVVKVVNRDLYDEINGMLGLVMGVSDKSLIVMHKEPNGMVSMRYILKEAVKATGKRYESLSEIVSCFDAEEEKEVFNVGDEVTYKGGLGKIMYGIVVRVYDSGVRLLTVDADYGEVIYTFKDIGRLTRTGTRFEELTTIIDRLKLLSGSMKIKEV